MAISMLQEPLILLLVITALCDVSSATSWEHGWESSSEMTFADFNSNELLTDDQAKFVAGTGLQDFPHLNVCCYFAA